MIRVLHVDDNTSDLELARVFLTRLSSEIDLDWARSAAEGLEKLERDKFDCVVVDYLMPGMNGLEMLERIRIDMPDIPFILFTGEGDEEVAARAMVLGADDYVEKELATNHYERLLRRILEVVGENNTQPK